jgi:hypothetical protein
MWEHFDEKVFTDEELSYVRRRRMRNKTMNTPSFVIANTKTDYKFMKTTLGTE